MTAAEWINSTRDALATRMRLAQQHEQSPTERSETGDQGWELADFEELSVSVDKYR
jgi:IS30 family transposase